MSENFNEMKISFIKPFFKKTMSKTISIREFSQTVIEEAQKPAGTWSYKFLSEVSKNMKKCKDSDYDEFIQHLLDFVASDDTEVLQVFKMSQLISTLKYQNPNKGLEIFEKNKEEILKKITEMPDSPLSQASKRHFKAIFTTTPIKPVMTSHIKSFSQEPKFVNGSPIPDAALRNFDNL